MFIKLTPAAYIKTAEREDHDYERVLRRHATVYVNSRLMSSFAEFKITVNGVHKAVTLVTMENEECIIFGEPSEKLYDMLEG